MNFNKTIGASALTNSYTESTWPIHINDLNCSGSEESIWNCPHNGLISYSCSHYDDAAVLCQSEYIYYTNIKKLYLQAYYVSMFALQLQGSTNYIFGRDNNSCNDSVWRNMTLFVGGCGYECCQFKSQQKLQILVL